MIGQYRNQSTPFRLSDVVEGRDTVKDLLNEKARFESAGKRRDDLTEAIKGYYGGICEAIEILQQEGQANI